MALTAEFVDGGHQSRWRIENDGSCQLFSSCPHTIATMSTPSIHKPTHYLKQLGPRRAPHELWAELLVALGFTVNRVDDSRSTVECDSILVAEIIGTDLAAIELKQEGITLAEPLIAPITEARRAAAEQVFYRIDFDAIAVHEAGHVVAAHILGRKFCHVRMCPIDNAMQWCSDDGPDNLDYTGDPDGVIDIQKVMAAGAAAEHLVFGWHREDGAAGDRKVVDNEIEAMKLQYAVGPPEEDPHVFDEYVRLAAGVLTKEKVRAVADALKQRSFLSRSDVEGILS